jgi:hypothetical protein
LPRNPKSFEILVKRSLAARWRRPFLGSYGRSDGEDVKIAAKAWSDEAKKVIPVIDCIDSKMLKNQLLTGDPLFMQSLKNFAYEFPKIAATDDIDQLEHLFEQRSKEDTALKESVWSVGLALIENKIPKPVVLEGRKSEWWKLEYYVWFVHWSKDALVEIGEFKYPWLKSEIPVSRDMREMTSRYGVDCFTKDMGGRGRIFLPGLFCLALYSETFDTERLGELKKQFEDETLMSFDVYRASLYETNSDWQKEYERSTTSSSPGGLHHLEP